MSDEEADITDRLQYWKHRSTKLRLQNLLEEACAEIVHLRNLVAKLKPKAKARHQLRGRADHAARMADGWRDLTIKRRPQ